MTDSLIEPIAGRHAVQKAIVGLDWSSDATDDHLAAVAAVSDRLKEHFPSRKEMQSITFNLGATAAPTPKLTGYQFQQAGPDGGESLARAFVVSGAQTAVSVEDYDRWASFRALVEGALSAVLPAIAEGRRLKSASLQYFDVFLWKGEPAQVSAGLFIRKETKWVPQHVFEIADQPWHSHHGFFAPDGPEGMNLLENININRHLTGETPSLRIHTIHQLSPQGELNSDQVLPFVLNNLDLLHDRNKRYLADLLVDDLRDLIQLGVK